MVLRTGRPSGVTRVLIGDAQTAGLHELVWRFIWIVVLTGAGAYGTYTFFTGVLVAKSTSNAPVVAIDMVKVGEHHLSGMVVVPTPCHGLSVRVEQLSVSDYHLAFETWQEPARYCKSEPDAKPFRTTVYAPSVGVKFIATLDGEPLPFDAVPYYR